MIGPASFATIGLLFLLAAIHVFTATLYQSLFGKVSNAALGAAALVIFALALLAILDLRLPMIGDCWRRGVRRLQQSLSNPLATEARFDSHTEPADMRHAFKRRRSDVAPTDDCIVHKRYQMDSLSRLHGLDERFGRLL